MKLLKGFVKLLAVALMTAALIWMLNLTVRGIAVATYKEGIKQGYNACKKDTGVFLDTRGLTVGEQSHTDNF